MSQATIALLIILFLGGGVAWWNGNRHDSGSHGGHSGYHQDHGNGGGSGNGGGGIHFPDPQQCS